MTMKSINQGWLNLASSSRWVALILVVTFFNSNLSISVVHGQQGRENAPGLNKKDEPKETAKNDRKPTKKPLDRTRVDYQITETGPHHRKWERVETITNELGEEEERIHRYTELGTGLNRWDEEKAEWIEASNVIEAFEGGAVARSGQTKVIFAPRLGAPEGTVDILTDDGERIRTVVLGLSYFDPVSGDDVVLSEVNPDVVGEILPPNRVIYRNAFTDIEADVIYEYHRDRFSQNIVLHESPAEPAAFGLSKLSRLEVLSEILEAPEPEKEVRVVKELAKDQKERRQMAEPDLIDETIRLGESSIGQGKAFELGDQPATEAIVTKRWVEDGGRTVLFEGVEFESAKEALGRLPSVERIGARPRAGIERKAQRGLRQIPARRYAQVDSNQRSPLQIASANSLLETGYLIDYELVIVSITDYVFKTGVTYLVDGRVYCYGTTTIEGGAVVKYKPYSSGNQHYLDLRGPINCQTQAYHPAIFTARDDDTVGEEISQGTLSGYYGYEAIRLGTLTSGNHLRHLRIKHALLGVSPVNGSGAHLSHIQFVNCRTAIGVDGTDATIENVLITDSEYRAVWGRNATIAGTNWTIHDTAALWLDLIPSSSVLSLTNSLLTEVASVQPYTGQGASHNVELSSATGVFQSAGGGHYYLANNSPYRDIGTSSIDLELAAELETRTTSPPTVLANPTTMTTNTTWSRHVARDDDGSLDLGYHYAALDYYIRPNVSVESGATLTVTSGTAIAIGDVEVVPGTSNKEFALLKVSDNCNLRLLGDPDDRIVWTFFSNVQEMSPECPNCYYQYLWFRSDTMLGAKIQCNIESVDFYAPLTRNHTCIQNAYFFYASTEILKVNHSRFFGCHLGLSDANGKEYEITNNLFFRCKSSTLSGNQLLRLSNNLFYGGDWAMDQFSGSPDSWVIQDNLFDAVTESWPGSISNGTLGHNGYLNTTFRPNGVTQSSDIVLSSLAYESGPFGDYYQPGTSPLINAGSQLADAAGLLHHTVLATGPPEGTASSVSMVDIGLHYPAVGSAEGGLLDSDWDGIPNVLEDQNGNGTTEAGESAWKASESPHSNGPGSIIIFNRSGATL